MFCDVPLASLSAVATSVPTSHTSLLPFLKTTISDGPASCEFLLNTENPCNASGLIAPTSSKTLDNSSTVTLVCLSLLGTLPISGKTSGVFSIISTNFIFVLFLSASVMKWIVFKCTLSSGLIIFFSLPLKVLSGFVIPLPNFAFASDKPSSKTL